MGMIGQQIDIRVLDVSATPSPKFPEGLLYFLGVDKKLLLARIFKIPHHTLQDTSNPFLGWIWSLGGVF